MAKDNVGEVYLKDVRASFLQNLFTPGAFEEDAQKKYSGTFLIDRSTSEGKKLVKACEAAIVAAVEKRYAGKKAPNWQNMKNDCFVDGDEKEYDGWAGMMAVTAKNTKRVPVFNRDKTPVTEEEGVVYAGCYVDAIVQFYVPKDEKYKNRICCSLQGVKFRRDGEAFAGRGATADDFEDFDDDDDDMPSSRSSKSSRSDDDDL